MTPCNSDRLRRGLGGFAAMLVMIALMATATPVAAGQGQSGNQRPLSDLLGSSVMDVLSGQKPALGETHLEVIFTNTAPGALLPNLVRAMGNLCFENDDHPVPDCPPPGVEVVELRFSAKVTGALHEAFGVPEGTPDVS